MEREGSARAGIAALRFERALVGTSGACACGYGQRAGLRVVAFIGEVEAGRGGYVSRLVMSPKLPGGERRASGLVFTENLGEVCGWFDLHAEKFPCLSFPVKDYFAAG